MNALVVSTYPPMACGIGKYAEQQVGSLRRAGHSVDVLSPADGGGDFTDCLFGGLRPLRLLKYVWFYNRVYIHFTPYFFYNAASSVNRLLTSLAFLGVMLLAGRRVRFIVHETHYRIGQQGRGRLRHRVDRWYWRLAHRVVFHSRRELEAFADFYRLPPGRRAFTIWPQDKYLVRLYPFGQAEARRALGLEPGVPLFLCIGFIQPHKGFERAIAAVREIPDADLRLKIVGSVRLDWDKAHQYAQQLHDMADRDPRVEVLEAYLGDELFDTWFVAADYVIVPYHEIWTSAVAARAKLYGRPMIAANAGGLAEQLTGDSYLFNNDEELVAILRRILSPPAKKETTHGDEGDNEEPIPTQATYY